MDQIVQKSMKEKEDGGFFYQLLVWLMILQWMLVELYQIGVWVGKFISIGEVKFDNEEESQDGMNNCDDVEFYGNGLGRQLLGIVGWQVYVSLNGFVCDCGLVGGKIEKNVCR